MALLFSLWTETVRPYLEIVDEWIVHGNLFDPAKEFIIQRYWKLFFSKNPKMSPPVLQLDFPNILSLFFFFCLQEQRRPGEPQGLLVRHLHSVQCVRDGGQRGEAERRSQWKLWRGSGLQQQAAHHGVLPQTCPQADHHGRKVHAAAQESGL